MRILHVHLRPVLIAASIVKLIKSFSFSLFPMTAKGDNIIVIATTGSDHYITMTYRVAQKTEHSFVRLRTTSVPVLGPPCIPRAPRSKFAKA